MINESDTSINFYKVKAHTGVIRWICRCYS